MKEASDRSGARDETVDRDLRSLKLPSWRRSEYYNWINFVVGSRQS